MPTLSGDVLHCEIHTAFQRFSSKENVKYLNVFILMYFGCIKLNTINYKINFISLLLA